jgi:hypothetical protein
MLMFPATPLSAVITSRSKLTKPALIMADFSSGFVSLNPARETERGYFDSGREIEVDRVGDMTISSRAPSSRPPKFVEDRYSPRERNEIVMRRSRTLWGRYWGYVGKRRMKARVVPILATVTVAQPTRYTVGGEILEIKRRVR